MSTLHTQGSNIQNKIKSLHSLLLLPLQRESSDLSWWNRTQMSDLWQSGWRSQTNDWSHWSHSQQSWCIHTWRAQDSQICSWENSRDINSSDEQQPASRINNIQHQQQPVSSLFIFCSRKIQTLRALFNYSLQRGTYEPHWCKEKKVSDLWSEV